MSICGDAIMQHDAVRGGLSTPPWLKAWGTGSAWARRGRSSPWLAHGCRLAHKVALIVAELGIDADSFTLHLWAALAAAAQDHQQAQNRPGGGQGPWHAPQKSRAQREMPARNLRLTHSLPPQFATFATVCASHRPLRAMAPSAQGASTRFRAADAGVVNSRERLAPADQWVTTLRGP